MEYEEVEIHTMVRYEDRLESRQHKRTKKSNLKINKLRNTRRSRVQLLRLPQCTMALSSGRPSKHHRLTLPIAVAYSTKLF